MKAVKKSCTWKQCPEWEEERNLLEKLNTVLTNKDENIGINKNIENKKYKNIDWNSYIKKNYENL